MYKNASVADEFSFNWYVSNFEEAARNISRDIEGNGYSLKIIGKFFSIFVKKKFFFSFIHSHSFKYSLFQEMARQLIFGAITFGIVTQVMKVALNLGLLYHL